MNTNRLRYLPQWIDVLAAHVAAWSSTRPLKARHTDSLPPPLLLLALRGEGLLRIQFIAWAETTPLANNPSQMLTLWSSLWDDGVELLHLCERIGLARMASQQMTIPVPDWSVQRSLYAAFIDALAKEERNDLLQLATDHLFALALTRQFPAHSPVTERITLATLQQRAHTHIQKSLAQPVKLREHFTTDEHTTHFTLRVAVNKGGWQDLLDCHGTRLKPLKRFAYQAVQEMDAASLREKLLHSARHADEGRYPDD